MHSRYFCSGSANYSGGYMSDMELVSLCAVAMALLNLYLLRQLHHVRLAVNMAWDILQDVAKGDVTVAWDGTGIKVTAVQKT